MKQSEVINDLNERLELDMLGLEANRITMKNAHELEVELQRQLSVVKAELAAQNQERDQFKLSIDGLVKERDAQVKANETLLLQRMKNDEKNTRKVIELRDALTKKRNDYDQLRNEYNSLRDEVNHYRTLDGKPPLSGLLSITISPHHTSTQNGSIPSLPVTSSANGNQVAASQRQSLPRVSPTFISVGSSNSGASSGAVSIHGSPLPSPNLPTTPPPLLTLRSSPTPSSSSSTSSLLTVCYHITVTVPSIPSLSI
jgi:hypothetical protein